MLASLTSMEETRLSTWEGGLVAVWRRGREESANIAYCAVERGFGTRALCAEEAVHRAVSCGGHRCGQS